MDEIKAVTDLAQNSLEYTKAVAEYGVLYTIVGLFLVLVLFQTIQNMYERTTLKKQLKSISEFCEKSIPILTDSASRSVNKEQAQSIIHYAFEKAKQDVIIQVANIKQRNDLDKTELVKGKIDLFICQSYNQTGSFLKKFTYNGYGLNTLVESRLKDVVFARVIEDCKTHDVDISKIEETYSIIFNSFKSGVDLKIDK